MTKDQIQEMLDAAVQYGHKTQKWNPNMKQFLHGSKNGVHIIDIYKTQVCIEKAQEFLEQMVSTGKTVLYVSTKPQATTLVVESAKKAGMPYVVNKWMCGLLTNYETMKQRIKYFNKLREEEKSGGLEKYTKKEASALRKDLSKLELALGGVREVTRLPDVLLVVDVVRDIIAVKEANKLGIPVVAIVDSNSDPENVDYPIPGNDDAIKSITYLIGAMDSAILKGKGSK